MNDVEIKPCPFCGSEADLHHDYSSESGDWYVVDCLNEKCPMFYSRGAWDAVNVTTGWRKTEEEAIESWNARYEKTCQNNAPSYLRFLCSECDYIIFHDDANETGDKEEDTPNYCPNCGCKVEH